MTIETNQTRVDYAGNGSPGPFSIPFPFISNTDLVVTYVTPSQAESILQLGYDYQVTGAGQSNGGALTLSKPLPTGYLLFIVRETPQLQPARYREQGPYSACQTERAFDRQTLALQDVSYNLARAIKLPKLNREVLNTDIQNVGASKVLQFTPDGRGIRAVYPRDIFLDQEEASINTPVQLLNHGFSQAQWLSITPTGFILADNSSSQTAEVVGCITLVVDADNFVLSNTGQATCFTGLNGGSVYFLGTAGQLTLTPPSTPGTVEKPLLVAQSATNGFIVNYRGKLIGSDVVGAQHNVTRQVTQNKHGFLQNQVVCFNVTTQKYDLAFAGGDLNHALGVGYIAQIVDSNDFIIVTEGYVSGVSFPNVGQLYLSETTPGQLTATPPSQSGHYIAPIIDCDSVSSGYVQISYPTVINNGANQTSQASSNQALAPGRIAISYTSTNGIIQFTLPNKAQIGDTFDVVGYNNASGWQLIQNANQQIHFLETLTTRGTSGSVNSTSQNDCFEAIVTMTDNTGYPTDFVIKSAVGNLNFV
jgi:hypothetical protein